MKSAESNLGHPSPEGVSDGYDKAYPDEAELTIEELNDHVLAYSTEWRVINGLESRLILRRPVILQPATPETRDLADRLTPKPGEVERLKAEVEELASSAYQAQQRYLRSLEIADDD